MNLSLTTAWAEAARSRLPITFWYHFSGSETERAWHPELITDFGTAEGGFYVFKGAS